jgi:hypothetical protein
MSFYEAIVPLMHSNASSYFQQFQHAINSLDTHANAVQQNPENVQYLHEASTYLQNLYVSGYAFPPTDTADGKLIRSLDADKKLQGAVTAQLGGFANSIGVDTQAALLITAYRYPRLAGEEGFSFAENAADTNRELERQLNESKSLFSEARDGLEALVVSMQQESLRQIDADSKQAADDRTEFKRTFDALTQTYDAKLALQAPITYWKNQLKQHQIAATEKKHWFIFASVFTLTIVSLFVYLLWGSFQAKNISEIPFSMWLITGAMIGLGFWVVRLFSRLYLSREHLMRDAEERVTMIETFLALMQHGNIEKDELKFVLAAIFRPTEDGLIKDDGLPAPLIELFQTAKTSKPS